MGFVEFTPKGSHPINFSFGQANVKDGVPYIMHESWLGSVPGNVTLLENNFRDYTIDKDANGKSILIIRTLGGGDMLFLSSVVKVIKNKYPDASVSFACVDVQKEIPEMIDGVDKVYPMPLPAEEFHKFDYHFEVSGLVEGCEENKVRNIYDIFLEKLGVEVDENGIAAVDNNFKRPFIKEDVYKDVPKDEKIIGIHPFANDPIRQLDPNIANLIAVKLIEKGYTVVIFCSKQEGINYSPFFDPRIKFAKGDNYTQAVLGAAACGHVIGCDSLMVHIAQAVGTNTIAIYGPFDSKTRVGYYKNINIVDTNPNCRCSAHNIGQCPKGFRISPCLNIDPEFIVKLVTEDVIPEIEYKGDINVETTIYNME